MFHSKVVKRAALATILALAFSAFGRAASITSNAPTVTLQATVSNTISVTLGSVTQVNFANLGTSTVTGDNPVSWTTNWNLDYTAYNTVNSCVYFASTNALTGGANSQNIPTSSVLGQPEATGSFSAITGTGCGQANALGISTSPITSSNNNNGSKSDSVALEVNPSGLGLAPGTYTGTLYIVSVADFE